MKKINASSEIGKKAPDHFGCAPPHVRLIQHQRYNSQRSDTEVQAGHPEVSCSRSLVKISFLVRTES